MHREKAAAQVCTPSLGRGGSYLSLALARRPCLHFCPESTCPDCSNLSVSVPCTCATVVMAPLTRCRADNPGAVPTEMMVRYYAQRAGAGLIISEGTIVSPRGRRLSVHAGHLVGRAGGWLATGDRCRPRRGGDRLPAVALRDACRCRCSMAVNCRSRRRRSIRTGRCSRRRVCRNGGAACADGEEIADIVADFSRGARNAMAAVSMASRSTVQWLPLPSVLLALLECAR